MSASDSIIIEAGITQAIATAVEANIAALKPQCPRITDVGVFGLFLRNPATGGNSGKRRDINPNGSKGRVDIVCNPNIPKGYQSTLRTCSVDIDCITRPDDDPDHELASYLYQAVRKVFDNKEFSLPAESMELRGYLITESAAGFTEAGFVVTLGVRFEVYVRTRTGEQP